MCVYGEEVDNRGVGLGSQYVTPSHVATKIDPSSRRGKASGKVRRMGQHIIVNLA